MTQNFQVVTDLKNNFVRRSLVFPPSKLTPRIVAVAVSSEQNEFRF